MNKWSLGFMSIACISLVLTLFVHAQSENDYNTALQNYRKHASIEARDNANSISRSLNYIYQGMRTISLLPSVKSIDRHGKYLDTNARESIVQIYNNMVSNVAVSEIYIVPVDIDPDAIDATTGKKQAPILMFDGQISSKVTGIGEGIEEDESQEYAQLHNQMAYLKQHYPDIAHIERLNPPFISGTEVITCDNTEYAKTKNDADRLGIIFSVPFYGDDGALRGTISAIIRSNVIKSMMPDAEHALINMANKYVVMSKDDRQARTSEVWVKKGDSNPNLLFSALIPIETPDPKGIWALWVGLSDSRFLDSADVKSIYGFARLGYVFIGLLLILSAGVWELQRRRSREMEVKILSRTAERMQFQERAELLEIVIQSANDGIIITNANLDSPGPEIIYVNDAFTQISGYKPEEVIGKSPRFFTK